MLGKLFAKRRTEKFCVSGQVRQFKSAKCADFAKFGGQHVFLLGGNDKKARKAEKQTRASDATARVRDVFLAGRFPVVTTHQVEGRRIAKVLGLVCCRGYDSEEAFFGMACRAMNKGAQAIVGYNENVAFHPDGSKYFSCFGTAVMFEYDPADPDSLPLMLQQKFREREQQPNSDMI